MQVATVLLLRERNLGICHSKKYVLVYQSETLILMLALRYRSLSYHSVLAVHVMATLHMRYEEFAVTTSYLHFSAGRLSICTYHCMYRITLVSHIGF